MSGQRDDINRIVPTASETPGAWRWSSVSSAAGPVTVVSTSSAPFVAFTQQHATHPAGCNPVAQQQQQQQQQQQLLQTELLFDAEVRVEDTAAETQQQSAEAKAARRRQQHKEVVARSRLRHKAALLAIREQETALGQRLHALLQRDGHSMEPSTAAVVVAGHQTPREGRSSLAARLHDLRQRYVLTVAMQERILRENDALKARLASHTKLHDVIDRESSSPTQQAAEEQSTPSTAAVASSNSSSSNGSWLFLEDDVPIYYVPLTEATCQELMRVVYQRMLALYSGFVYRRIAVCELQCFGWSVHRPLNVDRRVLRFQFTKTVRCVADSMDSIVDRTWSAFHDPDKFAKIYSTPVSTRVVQRVDRNTTVLLQNAPVESGRRRNIHYFNILARVRGLDEQRERVVALLKTIVNPSDCQSTGGIAPQLHEIEWMRRGISYLLLTEEPRRPQPGERSIRLHYGCDFECVSEEHARYLMVEVLGIACRWEQLILPSHCLTL